MTVLIDATQALTVSTLLKQIPESSKLVQKIESGQRFDSLTLIQGIGSLSSASSQELSFVVGPQYLEALSQTSASVVIMTDEVARLVEEKYGPCDFVKVMCPQPYLLYALLAQWFDRNRRPKGPIGVHHMAVVDQTAQIDATATVDAFVTIQAHVKIGAGVHIHSGCSIAHHVEIGADTIIYPNVTLYDSVKIGQRCIIHSGAVIGADGFGFAPNPLLGQGAWGKIAQLGSVLMGDDIEVGANTTIDRGALDNTIISNGVKLDNQIMIAHNCMIGEHTAIAACVGVAGSTQIGARCTIGGAAGVSGHLKIADDVHISGGTAVTANVNEPGRYTGVFPFASHAQWQRNAAVIGQLAQLRKRLRALERVGSATQPSSD
jgi:UDP-3-O-[3-hydroxymyristoyl] glucosamine N-acyltransferase